MDQPTATVIAAVVSALVVGGLAVLSNAFIGSRNQGKTEGVITEQVKGVTDRMDRRDAQVDSKFHDLDEENKDQWSKIHQHTAEIGYLQGKANGKAH